jgi:hypothetical protein
VGSRISTEVSKAVLGPLSLPALFAPNRVSAKPFLEFFTANIRNPYTRRAYARAAVEFAVWCEQNGLRELVEIEPVQVAAYLETLQTRLAAPSVKQHLAAIRILFDWIVVGQVVEVNPASPVRGPKYSIKKGKTPVFSAEEARTLLDSICLHTSTSTARKGVAHKSEILVIENSAQGWRILPGSWIVVIEAMRCTKTHPLGLGRIGQPKAARETKHLGAAARYPFDTAQCSVVRIRAKCRSGRLSLESFSLRLGKRLQFPFLVVRL